jgi:hypothetical protein
VDGLSAPGGASKKDERDTRTPKTQKKPPVSLQSFLSLWSFRRWIVTLTEPEAGACKSTDASYAPAGFRIPAAAKAPAMLISTIRATATIASAFFHRAGRWHQATKPREKSSV